MLNDFVVESSKFSWKNWGVCNNFAQVTVFSFLCYIIIWFFILHLILKLLWCFISWLVREDNTMEHGTWDHFIERRVAFFIEEVNEMKAQRKQVCSNMGTMAETSEAFHQKGHIDDHDVILEATSFLFSIWFSSSFILTPIFSFLDFEEGSRFTNRLMI